MSRGAGQTAAGRSSVDGLLLDLLGRARPGVEVLDEVQPAAADLVDAQDRAALAALAAVALALQHRRDVVVINGVAETHPFFDLAEHRARHRSTSSCEGDSPPLLRCHLPRR